MREHEWRKDKDGAESCAREGCTIRRGSMGRTWQRKKGAHWRYVAPAFGQAQPIPSCTGTDSAPEAKANEESAAVQLVRLAAEAGLPVRYVPKPAPSPLEVVRAAVAYAPDGMQAAALAAIATLEESIRAEERAKCIADAAKHCVCARDASAGCGCSACKTAENIRNRK